MKIKIVSMFVCMLMIATVFGTVSISNAESPPLDVHVYGGSIIVDGHNSGEDTVIITTSDQFGIDIGDTENAIIIDVDYVIDCPGDADDGKAEIEFGDGSDIDSKWSGTYASGQLHIDKLIDPGETFSVRLYGFFKDWWGILIDEDTVYMYGSTRPGTVRDFHADNPTLNSIDLSWTKGNGGEKTKIQRSTSDYPSSPSSGTNVYFGTGTSTTDSGLNPDTTYYYSAWAYDTDGETYSANCAQASGSTLVEPKNPTMKSISPTSGAARTKITFTFKAEDENNDKVKFKIEWGDGDTQTTSYFNNNDGKVTGTAVHEYMLEETYTLRVKAIDENGGESSWKTISFISPRSRPAVPSALLSFLELNLPALARLIYNLVYALS